jgi:hypothetical protein
MNDIQFQRPAGRVGKGNDRPRSRRRHRALIVAGVVAGGIAAVAGPSAAAAARPGGALAVTGYAVISGPVAVVPPGGRTLASAGCPSGTFVLGGGELNNSVGHVLLTDSYPSPSDTVWEVIVINDGPVNQTVKAYAVCGA